MLKNRVTMLILSCDKFSDLWDAHIRLLEENWGDRGFDTYIVTDKNTDRIFEKATIISAGEDKEFSERIGYALTFVKTEYVFITLDDYFLINPVDNERITYLLDMMDKESVDYIRLFKNPPKATKKQLGSYEKIYNIDLNHRYSVNLYSGIWRKSFMEKTAQVAKNPWKYEVSLCRIARENNAKCTMSKANEFVILDVVRKGKILNKANRYIRKHNLYNGDREIQSKWYEFKLAIRTLGVHYAPTWMVNMARSFMIKLGNHYFSQDE